jgi:hypothetical protein
VTHTSDGTGPRQAAVAAPEAPPLPFRRVALAFSLRTVVIAKGGIIYDGESAALAADPDRMAQFIGVAELGVSPRGSPSGRCPRR